MKVLVIFIRGNEQLVPGRCGFPVVSMMDPRSYSLGLDPRWEHRIVFLGIRHLTLGGGGGGVESHINRAGVLSVPLRA